MKVLFLSALILISFSSPAFAGKLTIGGILGFEQGAASFGGDVDYRKKKSTAWHAYFLYGTAAESFEISNFKIETQKISVGGGMKIFFGPKRWQLSVTPGFGAVMIDITQGVEGGNTVTDINDTLFGPILKFDTHYRLSRKWSGGLSYTIQSNWFSSNFATTLGFLTANIRYAL